MAKKPTRLRFTEDDLTDSQVKKAADRADKAADKAEKAVDKLASKKKATKLRQETDAAGSRKAKLRFGKADNSVAVDRPSSAKQLATRGTAVTLTSAGTGGDCLWKREKHDSRRSFRFCGTAGKWSSGNVSGQ